MCDGFRCERGPLDTGVDDPESKTSPDGNLHNFGILNQYVTVISETSGGAGVGERCDEIVECGLHGKTKYSLKES